MRPIVWGFIVCVLGGFFWILFSVVFGVTAGISEATGGPPMPSAYWGLIDLTGAAMTFGIPAGIVGEIFRWRRRKSAQKVEALSIQQTRANSMKYCSQCGKQVQSNLAFCGFCGSKF